MKVISQLTREEKIQEILAFNPCRTERNALLRYLLAVRRNDTEQIAYFESFGSRLHQIILNVRIYERGLIFGYVGKRFDEHGWLSGMLPIVERISLDSFNTIIIGQSIDGTYAVTVDWCTGTAGGGSHPSVWDEPIRDYKEAVRQGIRRLELQYEYAERNSVSDKGNYNPQNIRLLKSKLMDLKRKYIEPQQLSLF